VKKWLLGILIVIVGVIIAFWLLKAPIVSGYLSDKMGVPVSIGSLSIRPSHTHFKNFQIDNPRGFKKKAAFSSQDIAIDYDFHQLFQDPVVLDQIVLDNVYLNIEILAKNGKKTNWSEIGKKIAQHAQKQMQVQRGMVIKSLVLTNITVEVSGLKFIPILKIPPVQHFDRWDFGEVDSRSGFPTQELIEKIFGKAGVLDYIQGVFDQVQKLQKSLSPMKLFGDGAMEPPTAESP
jgi:hypothetical protein